MNVIFGEENIEIKVIFYVSLIAKVLYLMANFLLFPFSKVHQVLDVYK